MPLYSLRIKSSTVIALALLLILVITACESNAHRIREMNEDAANSAATGTPIRAQIQATKIQDGDCMNTTLTEGISIESVVIVPCSGSWQYRALSSFSVGDSINFPGEDFFERQAYERCGPRSTDYLFSLKESWALGEHKIDCLQKDFGLSKNDPTKLDHLIGFNFLKSGDCFNEAPETGHQMIELVGCTGDWESQIGSKFSVSRVGGSYPGDRYFQIQAEQSCELPWDYYYAPEAVEWRQGYREILCVRTLDPALRAKREPTANPGTISTPQPTSTPRPMATPGATATPHPTTAPTIPPITSMHNTQNARWIKQMHPLLHQKIAGLPWVKDGLDDEEKKTIDSILYTAVTNPALAEGLIKLPWIGDGLHQGENDAVEEFYFVAHQDPTVAQDLLGMPFLASNEPADLHALNGIHSIIRDGLTTSLTSSRVYQEGMTDELTPVVAAAAATGSTTAINEYLNDQSIAVDTKQYATAGQPIAITIVSLKNSTDLAETSEAAYQAVIDTEAIMQMPLPTRHVIVVLDHRAVLPGYAGTNYGYAIGVDKEKLEGAPARLQNNLYHEIAHYWWRGHINWIDEGIADTIAASASLARGDELEAKPNRRRDCTSQNLGNLGHTTDEDRQFYCNYFLGEKLFRALQTDMTPSAFTTAILALYSVSRAKPRPQEKNGYRADIEDVRKAFPGQREIIEIHYTGDLNAPHRWDPDDALNFTHHDAVIWTQKPTYQNGIVSFSGRLAGEATLVSRNITEARQGRKATTFTIGEGNLTIGSILPKLTDGSYWTLDDPADVIADLFEIHRNTFNLSFGWPATADNPIGKRIGIWGYNNTDRMPVLGNTADLLGVSLIR